MWLVIETIIELTQWRIIKGCISQNTFVYQNGMTIFQIYTILSDDPQIKANKSINIKKQDRAFL